MTQKSRELSSKYAFFLGAGIILSLLIIDFTQFLFQIYLPNELAFNWPLYAISIILILLGSSWWRTKTITWLRTEEWLKLLVIGIILDVVFLFESILANKHPLLIQHPHILIWVAAVYGLIVLNLIIHTPREVFEEISAKYKHNVLLTGIMGLLLLSFILRETFEKIITIPGYIGVIHFCIITLSLTFFMYILSYSFFIPPLVKNENQKVSSAKVSFFPLVILIATIVLISGLLLFQLGKKDFRNDEFTIVEAAKAFSVNGQLYKYDWITDSSGPQNCLANDPWCDYTRAEVYIAPVGILASHIGFSEFNIRIISVMCGVLFLVLLSYIVFQLTQSYSFSSLAVLCVGGSAYLLYFFRYARMYAPLITTVLAFFVSVSLITHNARNYGWTSLKSLSLYCLTGVLFLLAYELQNLSLLLLPGTIFFMVYWLGQEFPNHRKSIWITSIAICIIGAGIFIVLFNRLAQIDASIEMISPFSRLNTTYFVYTLRDPIGIAGLALIIGILSAIYRIEKKVPLQITFALFLLSTGLGALVFLIERFSHPSYSVYLIGVYIFLLIYVLSELIKRTPRKTSFIVSMFIAFLIAWSFFNNAPYVYGAGDPYYANYKEAYKTVIEHYDSQHDALFLQYSRSYYLKDLNYSGGKVYSFGAKNYSMEAEKALIKNIYDSGTGWIIWDSFTSGDIRTSTKKFIYGHAKKYHGEGIDTTQVEIYYFNSATLYNNTGAINAEN